MKRIVVTGATSFIGRHLIDLLIKKDYEIIAVVRKGSSRLPKALNNEKIQVIELNLDEYALMHKYIVKPVDVFVHLAWNGTRGSDRDNKKMQEENYIFSIEAVKEAIKIGCKRFISAGSQAEYGICNSVVTEETICNPVTYYGKEKLKFYEDALEICKKNNVEFKEPRFFSLYGSDDFSGTMIISIINKMLKNEPCELTEGIQMWDFLHIDDAVKGIERLMDCNCPDGVYNFGSGDARILIAFIDEMKECSASKSQLLYGAVPYPITGMVTIEPDISKMQRETGWYPTISFRDGITEIINKMKKEELYEKN